MHPFAVLDLGQPSLHLELAFLQFTNCCFPLLERRLRRGEPLTALIELRRQAVDLSLTLRERALALQRAGQARIDVAHGALPFLDLGLRRAELLAARIEPRFARVELIRPLSKLLGQAVQSLGALVQLRCPPRDRLVEPPLPVGERSPGFGYLVAPVGHGRSFAGPGDAPIGAARRLDGRTQVYELKSVFFPAMRGRVPAILVGIALAAPAFAAAAAAEGAKNLGCGAGKLVLNVHYRVVNDLDTGIRGNNWAFDNYARTVHVWRKSAGRYCAASTYTGTFTTIAGTSPGGRTAIPAGIRGDFKGESVTTFRAAQRSDATTTTGDLGTKDFQCTSDDTKGQCAGTFDWLSAYFRSTDNFKTFTYVRYAFTYHATEGGRGTWTDQLVGRKYQSHGDITALKKH